ncbi:Proline iminopeptidase [Sphingomonas antarctica]|uniref:alpha/beta fold hydrolase n=1 Tax=Sphingomonas antarctica TaxID=2040274 RepID=UPI0039EA437A
MLRHLTLSAALLALAAAPAPDPYMPGREIVTDLNKIVTANGVQETFETRLGGARQIVNVRGADKNNPILVFIHGGPASVEMPLAWSFQRPWEDYFTVVHWDQRGAGRSFPLNDQAALAPTLKPERYRDDTIELIEQLRQRYGKRKVVLMGLSWGSLVGLMVAEKRPDLLYAYVGVGQLIDFRENEVEGYNWTLAEARRRGDALAVKELQAIAPYPGPGAFDLQKLDIERKWNVAYGGLLWGRPDPQFYFHLGRLSPEYTLADRQAWDAGSAYTMKILWPQLADMSFKRLTRLDVPVVLLLGRHDTTTASTIAARWFAGLKAPKKRLVWFENSAHIPIFEEPGRTFAALLTEVRPLAQPGDDLPK